MILFLTLLFTQSVEIKAIIFDKEFKIKQSFDRTVIVPMYVRGHYEHRTDYKFFYIDMPVEVFDEISKANSNLVLYIKINGNTVRYNGPLLYSYTDIKRTSKKMIRIYNVTLAGETL